MTTSAREIVTRHVAKQAARFPELSIEQKHALDVSGLQSRDAALAMAIEHAVNRRWLTLAAVLRPLLSRPWDRVDHDIQAVLLVGAAQLLLLDRVPDHAAINEAVELTKRTSQPKASGLVNAVLRKVAGLRSERVEKHEPGRADEIPFHDGGAWRLNREVFSDDPLRRLAEQTSHGQALLARWHAAFGAEQAAELAYHSLVHAPIVIAGCDETPPGCQPHERDGFCVYGGNREDLDALLAGHPQLRVQDTTAAAAVAATSDLRPKLIIDACAGMGTKTRQLASLHPEARIIAAELDHRRRTVLNETFADSERVEVMSFEEIGQYAQQADLLVLDVPCSNTGVLARRVEAKYRFSDVTLKKLVDVQRQIIADSLGVLAEGGRLLYATCSIEPAENERQAEWVAKWHRLQVEKTAAAVPTGQAGDDPVRYADGGYFALFGPGKR